MVSSQAALDVYLGFVAFFSGVGLTLLCTRAIPGRDAARARRGNSEPAPPASNDTSRAEMAIQQLHDMALNVASDVNAHKTIVGKISDRLAEPSSSSEEHERVVTEAADELMQANAILQARLEVAEQRIQSQAQEIQMQQTAAQTDALTGLANRRAFDAALEESRERLQREARPFSVVMFDVDHFKQLNDTYGHLAGDEVLRSLGRLLPKVLKSGDMPCRYGGEEFAIILRGANILEAQAISERVRAAIESLEVTAEGKRLTVTASLGAAEGGAGEQALGIVRRADDCVYASKRAGRNCCHWHNGAACVLAEPPKGRIVAVRRPATTASGNQLVGNPLMPAKVLPDRQMLTELIDRAMAESDRSGHPLALLQICIRNYDSIVQSHGADGAGVVEAYVAQGASLALRDMDVIGHLGPGEFMAVLTRCTESAAKIITQRVLASVPTSIRLPGGDRLTLGLASGLASKDGDQSTERLMARARHACSLVADAEASPSPPAASPVGVR